jgi:hypothetical protein
MMQPLNKSFHAINRTIIRFYFGNERLRLHARTVNSSMLWRKQLHEGSGLGGSRH